MKLQSSVCTLARLILLSAFTLVTSICNAQTQTQTRTVTLTWDYSSTDTRARFQVYRSATACGDQAASFTKVGLLLTDKTYEDKDLAIGRYCYRVTAFILLSESVPSNLATADLLPYAPDNLKLTIQVEIKQQIN